MANFLASFYSKNKVKVGDVISIDGAKGRIRSDESSVVAEVTDPLGDVVFRKRIRVDPWVRGEFHGEAHLWGEHP